MDSKINIILPVYNVQTYLPQCLDSILAQSYSNWEALLIDDGSLDCSGTICDEYAGRDMRFRVFHKENGGAASAKNIGLDYVTGQYVAFLDSDDYVEPHWLETLVTAAETYQADIVECGFDKVYRNYSLPVDSIKEPIHSFTAEAYLAQYLSSWSCSLFWNKLIRSDMIGDLRFRRERRCIDDEFFTYKVASRANKIVRIYDVLYHYRQRGSSAVWNPDHQLQITDDALEILVERYQWISELFPGLRKIYLSHDIDILFYFAGFYHNQDTALKFHRISRFYLNQVLHAGLDVKLLKNALKLQTISSRSLIHGNLVSTKKSGNTRSEQYFD